MPIDSRFDTTIYVQTESQASFGGGKTYANDGSNIGYIRKLSGAELAVYGKRELTVTHKAVMSVETACSFGKFLYDGSVRYKVQLCDGHELSGGDFQTVICEEYQ